MGRHLLRPTGRYTRDMLEEALAGHEAGGTYREKRGQAEQPRDVFFLLLHGLETCLSEAEVP